MHILPGYNEVLFLSLCVLEDFELVVIIAHSESLEKHR